MNLPSSLHGRERVRLFCALTLPDDFLDGLVRWQRKELAGDSRPPAREQLHITLAFLGRRPVGEIERIAGALRDAAAEAQPFVLRPLRYRETPSVGMLILDDPGGGARRLAADLQSRLAGLGVYEPEQRPWLPHITVLRFRRRPGLTPPTPDLGEVSPSEVALYHSVLRPTGAQYDILEAVALGG